MNDSIILGELFWIYASIRRLVSKKYIFYRIIKLFFWKRDYCFWRDIHTYCRPTLLVVVVSPWLFIFSKFKISFGKMALLDYIIALSTKSSTNSDLLCSCIPYRIHHTGMGGIICNTGYVTVEVCKINIVPMINKAVNLTPFMFK